MANNLQLLIDRIHSCQNQIKNQSLLISNCSTEIFIKQSMTIPSPFKNKSLPQYISPELLQKIKDSKRWRQQSVHNQQISSCLRQDGPMTFQKDRENENDQLNQQLQQTELSLEKMKMENEILRENAENYSKKQVELEKIITQLKSSQIEAIQEATRVGESKAKDTQVIVEQRLKIGAYQARFIDFLSKESELEAQKKSLTEQLHHIKISAAETEGTITSLKFQLAEAETVNVQMAAKIRQLQQLNAELKEMNNRLIRKEAVQEIPQQSENVIPQQNAEEAPSENTKPTIFPSQDVSFFLTTIYRNCLQNKCDSSGKLSALFVEGGQHHASNFQRHSPTKAKQVVEQFLQGQAQDDFRVVSGTLIPNLNKTLSLKENGKFHEPVHLLETVTHKIEESPGNSPGNSHGNSHGNSPLNSHGGHHAKIQQTERRVVYKYRKLKEQFSKMYDYFCYLHGISAKWLKIKEEKQHRFKGDIFGKLAERLHLLTAVLQKLTSTQPHDFVQQLIHILTEAHNSLQFLDQIHKKQRDRHPLIIGKVRDRHYYRKQKDDRRAYSHSDGDMHSMDYDNDFFDVNHCEQEPSLREQHLNHHQTQQNEKIEVSSCQNLCADGEAGFSQISSVKGGHSQLSSFLNSHTELIHMFEKQDPKLANRSAKTIRKMYKKSKAIVTLLQNRYSKREKEFKRIFEKAMENHHENNAQMQRQFNQMVSKIILMNEEKRVQEEKETPKQDVQNCFKSKRKRSVFVNILDISEKKVIDEKEEIAEQTQRQLRAMNESLTQKINLLETSLKEKIIQLEQSEKRIKILTEKIRIDSINFMKLKENSQQVKREFNQFMCRINRNMNISNNKQESPLTEGFSKKKSAYIIENPVKNIDGIEEKTYKIAAQFQSERSLKECLREALKDCNKQPLKKILIQIGTKLEKQEIQRRMEEEDMKAIGEEEIRCLKEELEEKERRIASLKLILGKQKNYAF